MEAATSTFQHHYGLGPRGPDPHYGAPQDRGPHPPSGPGPSGAPRPEEQQHHKPFFYIQPSQPYMPMQSMQWPVPVPMPMSYNPYYPGLGYGMPMMPQYQPNPYMEPPGFVVPTTHLHLMDYRRMLSPQYYQTMAYHSRRFRYQHNSQTREMTSSEVQTEPLSAAKRTSTPGSSEVEAPRGLPVRSSNIGTGVAIKEPLSPALSVQKGDHSVELKDMAPSSTTRTPPPPPNGSFVIQTEEVRIECCTTPVGLQLLHARETAEVSHMFSQDVVQCCTGSNSVLQGRVVRQDEGRCLPAEQSEKALVGMASGGEKLLSLEDSRNQTDRAIDASDVGSQVSARADVQETSDEKDPSKNFQFKVVHLPFDPKYLDELWKMESTVWSMEETLIPSPGSLVQNGRSESHDETPACVNALPSAREDPEEFVPVIQMLPLAEDEQDDMVAAVEEPPEDMCHFMDVAVLEEAPTTEFTHTAEVDSPLKADRNIQDHQDTSFESLPAYLPSTSWLADFDNVYYCSKMPPTPKKQTRPPSSRVLDVPTRRRKLDFDYKDQLTVRKPKARYKPKGKVDRRSLSDHECCINRNFNENSFTPYASKRERLCSRCVAKSTICTTTSLGLDGRPLKRKAAVFQQWNDTLLPTCEACKSHSNKRLVRKGSNPDVRGPLNGHDTEEESSENSSCRLGSKWRAADRPWKLNNIKMPLASRQNVDKCPTTMQPKLREKNCLCNEPQNQSVSWERQRHCPHGNAIREMDENCAAPDSLQDKCRVTDQIYLTHSRQTEKSWKAGMPNHDSDGSKNEARAPYFNKHKKPQSQGTRF
ncbi:uncharacterized protein buc2l [Anoplopoma fimbria]|uniref:uncharacterized protein buc2l n=1 Tax=Anoplopoma fimbria TaxID=229290 RepID=UPI0023EDF21B|nr:uncharacterized protein buc2l [Anoplopoma fimbria]